MADLWIYIASAAAAVVASGLVALAFRSKDRARSDQREPAAPIDGREMKLARQLSRVVGCTVAQALSAVRREMRIAPNQSDDTLIKRAAYHYRQEQPEQGCPVYRDRAAG